MRKGFDGYQVIGVFTNAGSGGSAGVNLPGSQTGFAAGEALVDVMSCTASAADASGGITATLEGGIPRVYYPADRLFGSGICSSLAGERSR